MAQRRGWTCITFFFISVAMCVLPLPVNVYADDNVAIQEIKNRLDRLEKENQELKQQLQQSNPINLPKVGEGSGTPPGTQIIQSAEPSNSATERIKKIEPTGMVDQKAPEWFAVGERLGAKATFRDNVLWFESEDKSFQFRVGGRLQIDSVWVHATQRMMAPLSQNGIGEYDDAINFRRARLQTEGRFWEVFEYYCQFDFVNTTRIVTPGAVVGADGKITSTAGTAADRTSVINIPVPTDLWIQWTQLPIIGNIRIGNQKGWIGLEHTTSSAFLNFMERSLAFDAFIENGNNGFVPGISIWSLFLDNHLIYGMGIYRPNYRDIFGWDVGDGETQYDARIAGTPVYRDEGKYLLHLGLGARYSTADDGVIRFRARPAERNGPAALHNIIAQIQGNLHNNLLIVPELWINYGPLSLGAEYYASWSQQNPGGQFTAVGNQSRNSDLPKGGRGTLYYQGAYVELGYFLTGESRGYSLKRMAPDRQPVNEKAFLVRGGNDWLYGRGAWQLTARYTYLDLDSKGVNGGVINDMTLGINWFLNPNAKIQTNYSLAYRDATQYSDGKIAPQGTSIRDGLIQSFGTTFRFDF